MTTSFAQTQVEMRQARQTDTRWQLNKKPYVKVRLKEFSGQRFPAVWWDYTEIDDDVNFLKMLGSRDPEKWLAETSEDDQDKSFELWYDRYKLKDLFGGKAIFPVKSPYKAPLMPKARHENIRLITQQNELVEVISDLAKRTIIAIDVETSPGIMSNSAKKLKHYALDPYLNKLLCVQIAYIKPDDGTPYVYILDGQLDLKELARIIFTDKKILKLLHNAKFDRQTLAVKTGYNITNIYDTMLAERCLVAGSIDHKTFERVLVNLGAVAKRHLDIVLDKAVRTDFAGIFTFENMKWRQALYAARDVTTLFPIYSRQLAKAYELDLVQVIDLECQVVEAVADMELAGCKIGLEKWKEMVIILTEIRDDIKERLLGYFPEGGTKQLSMFEDVKPAAVLNLSSPAQAKKAFKRIGIILKSVKDEELEEINHPAVKLFQEYKRYEKAISAFGKPMLYLINPITGRIHPDFDQYGADTGRFSCKQPNFQQIPNTSYGDREDHKVSFRSAFIAETGWKMVDSDYSQAELRVLAQQTQDEVLIEAFIRGDDVHSAVGARLFKLPIEEITKALRNKVKPLNFGLAYGMSPAALSVQLSTKDHKVSLEEATELYNEYFATFPKIKRFLDNAGRETVESGFSYTSFGRIRWFWVANRPQESSFDMETEKGFAAFKEARRKWFIQKGKAERAGKNMRIQGENAEFTKIALVYLYNRIITEGLSESIKIVSTIHDEILLEAKEEISQYAATMLQECMESAEIHFITSVPVKADPMIGDYWCK